MSQTKAQLISDLVQALNFTGTASAPANGLFLSASNQLKLATASTERLKIDGTEVVVNDTGASVDFRVEGDTEANLLFADASTDRIGIGTSGPGSLLSLVGATDAVTGISLGATTTISTSRYIGICQAANETNIAVNSGFQGIEFGGPSSAKEGYLAFHTHDVGVSSGERVRITKGGQVGIGTNDPGSLLSISGANDSVTGISLGPASTSITHSRYIGLTDTNNNANLGANSGFQGIEFGGPGSANEGYLAFHTHDAGVQSSECLRMDKSGNIGIGTTTPTCLLNVNTPASGTTTALEITRTTHGTVGKFINSTGALEIQSNKQLILSSDPAQGMTAAGSLIQFDIDGGTKAVIDSSGFLGIGTTSPNAHLHINSGTSGLPKLRLEHGGAGNDVFEITSGLSGISNGGFGIYDVDESTYRFAIDSSGRAGIGITSIASSTRLALSEASGNAQTLEIIAANNTGAGSQPGIKFTNNSGGNTGGIFADTNSGQVRIQTGGNPAMTVDTSQNVGVGTTSPDGKFNITNGTAGSVTAASDANLLVLESNQSNGMSFLNDSAERAVIRFGTTGTNGQNEASISYAHEAVSTSADRRSMIFKTGGNNEIMRLKGGKLRIGADEISSLDYKTKISSSSETYVLLLAENATGGQGLGIATRIDGAGSSSTAIRFFDGPGAASVSTVNVNATTVTYGTGSSDRTMKKNFENWTDSVLNSFKNLNPQKFNYLVEDDADEKHKGFVAQDLVADFPEAYPKDTDTDKYNFNPSGMVVYLMKAIQELEAEVAALKAA